MQRGEDGGGLVAVWRQIGGGDKKMQLFSFQANAQELASPEPIASVSPDGQYVAYTDEPYSFDRPGTGVRDPIANGYFRENCSGWVFDARGRPLFGASAALERHSIRIIAGEIAVDTRVVGQFGRP